VKESRPPGPSTQAVHAGEPRQNPYGSVTTPIVQTSTYAFPNTDALEAFMAERMFWDKAVWQSHGARGRGQTGGPGRR